MNIGDIEIGKEYRVKVELLVVVETKGMKRLLSNGTPRKDLVRVRSRGGNTYVVRSEQLREKWSNSRDDTWNPQETK